MPNASEFSPELSQAYLASLLNPIEERERAEVGAARNEGAAAGLVGQASTGTRIGAAAHNASVAEDNAISGFNLNVAGKQYDERMTDENRAFQDTQRQKSEDFQKSMTKMGYEFQDKEREARRKSDSDFNGVGFFSGLAGTALSAYAGNYAGAASGALSTLKSSRKSPDGAGNSSYDESGIA